MTRSATWSGRPRGPVTDTLGLLLVVVVLAASTQDRDGANPVLLDTYPPRSGAVRLRRRRLRRPATPLGKAHPAAALLRSTLHIVRKPAGQRGFAVIPRRWAVERTFAWLTAHRRLARDYERDSAVSEAMIRWAAINTITRRIAADARPPGSKGALSGRRLIFSNTFLLTRNLTSRLKGGADTICW
jgi:transposase